MPIVRLLNHPRALILFAAAIAANIANVWPPANAQSFTRQSYSTIIPGTLAQDLIIRARITNVSQQS